MEKKSTKVSGKSPMMQNTVIQEKQDLQVMKIMVQLEVNFSTTHIVVKNLTLYWMEPNVPTTTFVKFL